MKKNKLILFYLNPCTPCSMLKNYLEMIGVTPDESYKKGEYLDLESKYQIMGAPTLLLVDENDNEIDRVTGVGQSKIQALIDKM